MTESASTSGRRWERFLLAAAGGGLACRCVGPVWQPQVMTASFSPYLAALGLPAAVFSARGGRTMPAALGLAVAAAGLLVHRPGRRAARAAGPVRVECTLTVLSANLLHGRAGTSDLLSLARRHDVGVLLLQEFTHDAAARLAREGIEREYPYAVVESRVDGAGTALFSRHPISDPISHPELTFAAVSALVHGPGAAPIRVAAVHPVPPWPYPLSQHRRDYRSLEQLLATFTRDHRVVIGGDFNATLDHRQFRRLLRAGYHDAAREAGPAWLPTFPAGRWYPPLLGIDHVLTRALDAIEVRRVELVGSDHRGVLARLVQQGGVAGG